MYLTIDGTRIARRTLPKGVKTWTQVKPGWMVIDTNGPLAIQIKHNGKRLDWAGESGPAESVTQLRVRRKHGGDRRLVAKSAARKRGFHENSRIGNSPMPLW